MKKLLLLLFVSFLAFGSYAQTVTIDALRKDFHKVASDSAACAKLYDKISGFISSDNMINGYKGAISAAMANHIKIKGEKLKVFNAGKKLLEQSIKTDAQNAELRFLRFTIQTNAPKVLGYNEQIQNDKNFVISNLESIKNTSLRKKIVSYLIESSYVTEDDKKKLTIEK